MRLITLFSGLVNEPDRNWKRRRVHLFRSPPAHQDRQRKTAHSRRSTHERMLHRSSHWLEDGSPPTSFASLRCPPFDPPELQDLPRNETETPRSMKVRTHYRSEAYPRSNDDGRHTLPHSKAVVFQLGYQVQFG